jgi:uncharacterized protein
VFPLDLVHFSALRTGLAATPQGQQLLTQVPLPTIAWVIVATLPIQALFNLPFNFGEEWGWRGYLLPRMLPLGQWRALLLSGAIWGFWHAPLILVGFDYPQHRILGVALITLLGMIFGTILGWTRLATGSVWPAVLGHDALDANQILGGVYVLLRAGAPLDTALAGITGVTGLILPLLFVITLALTRRLPVRNPPDLAEAVDVATPAAVTAAGPGAA